MKKLLIITLLFTAFAYSIDKYPSFVDDYVIFSAKNGKYGEITFKLKNLIKPVELRHLARRKSRFPAEQNWIRETAQNLFINKKVKSYDDGLQRAANVFRKVKEKFGNLIEESTLAKVSLITEHTERYGSWGPYKIACYYINKQVKCSDYITLEKIKHNKWNIQFSGPTWGPLQLAAIPGVVESKIIPEKLQYYLDNPDAE